MEDAFRNKESIPVGGVPPAFPVLAGGLPNPPGCTPSFDADSPSQMQIPPPRCRPPPPDADPLPPDADHPGCRPLWVQTPYPCMQIPWDADPPPLAWRSPLPGCRRSPQMHIPTALDADPPGHVTSDACWEANSPVNRMADMCITLPQTLFAGGNKY